MVGGAAPVLGTRRALALGGLLALLAAWSAFAGALPAVGLWPDTLVIALVVLPATFAVVWLALPLAGTRYPLWGALAAGGAALALYLLGADSLFDVAKLATFALGGFAFLEPFHALSWVVLVAVLVPWVDAVSVWQGPTDYVVSEQPGLLEALSIGFRVPGEETSAFIGPPDVLFFALFLGAAQRWQLRTGLTWLAMTALLSTTLILTVALDVAGLPALPALSAGFLGANADLLWRRFRGRGAGAARPTT